MRYVLSGPDDFSLAQSLEEIKKGIGDQTIVAANTTILDGQQVTLNQLRTICGTAPFLAERRLVIIEGLLGRFEPRGKSRRRKTTVTGQDEPSVLGDYLSNIPDSIVLVLIESKIGSNNPLFRQLSARAEVKSFPLLKDARLRQWLQRRVADEGGSISPQAAGLLVKLVGSNLWVMASEINKLVLFASGRRIEEDDVKMVVSYAQQTTVFDMVDAVLDFKAGAAGQILQQLLQKGAPPAYLLVMLSRQLRMIVRTKELQKQGKAKTEIQNRLGLTSEFALHKTMEQANRYPWHRLEEIYRRLLEADLSIKTGKYDGDLALDILVAELCQRKV